MAQPEVSKVQARAVDRARTRPITSPPHQNIATIRCELCAASFTKGDRTAYETLQDAWESAISALADHYLERHSAVLVPAFIAICPKCGTEFPIR